MTKVNIDGVKFYSEDEVQSLIAAAVQDAVTSESVPEDKLWIKVYDDKVTVFRSQKEADQHKTSPRADRRFILDISGVQSLRGWQHFIPVEDYTDEEDNDYDFA